MKSLIPVMSGAIGLLGMAAAVDKVQTDNKWTLSVSGEGFIPNYGASQMHGKYEFAIPASGVFKTTATIIIDSPKSAQMPGGSVMTLVTFTADRNPMTLSGTFDGNKVHFKETWAARTVEIQARVANCSPQSRQDAARHSIATPQDFGADSGWPMGLVGE